MFIAADEDEKIGAAEAGIGLMTIRAESKTDSAAEAVLETKVSSEIETD